ncbi:hypothetical protein KKB43_04270 [Patescibacteria group bacterium]|nr:hypothetical protein [Patescibacteria group bacterium]MBU4339008.1 hypothetical protein [Patescibacteria group bacterium]MBU4580204.1 hypothetical protein [Patescibacteria group bacterium]
MEFRNHDIPDEMKFGNTSTEILPEQKQNELQNEASSSEELEKYEKWTKELKHSHSKTVNKLTKIVKDAGFKKLFIKPFFNSGDIEVDPDIDREAILFPEDGLENHELLELIDCKFAQKGFRLVALHEKQHLKCPADKFIDDYKKTAIESQTNLQSINKNNKEFKDLVDAIATDSVYVDVIYSGVEALEYKGGDEQYVFYEDNYNFLKLDIIDKIVERENEIRKELLEKYNKIKGNLENE